MGKELLQVVKPHKVRNTPYSRVVLDLERERKMNHFVMIQEVLRIPPPPEMLLNTGVSGLLTSFVWSQSGRSCM